ncbi:unnamed protein product [Amoebophrya sp. A25]|nr:unnamed protein product [Amoebophrya sp. A25]|eukprot:GSA25T00016614001.1
MVVFPETMLPERVRQTRFYRMTVKNPLPLFSIIYGFFLCVNGATRLSSVDHLVPLDEIRCCVHAVSLVIGVYCWGVRTAVANAKKNSTRTEESPSNKVATSGSCLVEDTTESASGVADEPKSTNPQRMKHQEKTSRSAAEESGGSGAGDTRTDPEIKKEGGKLTSAGKKKKKW